jgi:hypothetical protein
MRIAVTPSCALRRARQYALRAGVSERELVEYLKGKLL